MNYLAHAYLSFDEPDILLGNMISDFIKGKSQFNYPVPVQRGIKLHRLIDAFTDTHPATLELKLFFRPAYRLYAGAFADIVYDHFLANDRGEFSNPGDLSDFAARTYQLLEINSSLFPPAFQRMFPFMKQQDWLSNYRLKEGIQKSFTGLQRRAMYIPETNTAFEIFKSQYAAIQDCYNLFFPDVKKFAREQFDTLVKN